MTSSPLLGPAGNRETFVWIADPGRSDGRVKLEAEVEQVEA